MEQGVFTWIEIWKFHSTALLLGCGIDWLIGDPAWLPHPIRLMGSMILWLERRIRGWIPQKERTGGMILTAVMCLVWWGIPFLVFGGAEKSLLPGSWIPLLLIESLWCSQMLAARGLYSESMKVCRSLEKGKTEEARINVSMIVGRDTAPLNSDGIARAAVETVAENASDGVIAPFLFLPVSAHQNNATPFAVSPAKTTAKKKVINSDIFGFLIPLLHRQCGSLILV